MSWPVKEVSIILRRPNLSITEAPQKACGRYLANVISTESAVQRTQPMFHIVKHPLMIDCVRGFVIPTPLSTTTR